VFQNSISSLDLFSAMPLKILIVVPLVVPLSAGESNLEPIRKVVEESL
jgi:hypothetical protein